MTKIEVKATPEWLAQQEVRFDEDNGLVMLGTNGLRVSVVDKNCHGLGVHTGVPLLRRWLVEQIEAGYNAGVEAGRAEAKPAPTDAAAESAAIDGLVDEAARLDSKNDRGTTLHHRDGDIAIFLEDTRSVYVRAWLRPWLLAAWARGVAYGQQPDAPPALAESFGVAAQEQVAAERAVDAAAVAPGEEALAAAREEGRRAGIEEATTSLNEYLGRRLVRLANAARAAEEARKAAAQRNAEVAQLTVETETLREALDVLFDTKEAP